MAQHPVHDQEVLGFDKKDGADVGHLHRTIRSESLLKAAFDKVERRACEPGVPRWAVRLHVRAVLAQPINRQRVVRSRGTDLPPLFRSAVRRKAWLNNEVLSIAGDLERKVILVVVHGAVRPGGKEEVTRITIPSRAHGIQAGPFEGL